MICHTPAVREALTLQESHILVRNGLSEFIQKPGFPYSGFRHDGEGLPPACLRPLKTIKQKLKFPLSSHKWSKTSFGTDIKAGSPCAGGDHSVYPNWLLLALDLSLPQTLKAEETLRKLECLLGHVAGSWLSQSFHSGGHIHCVSHGLELNPEVVA